MGIGSFYGIFGIFLVAFLDGALMDKIMDVLYIENDVLKV